MIEALSAETLHFPEEEQDQMSCIFVNLLFCIETLALVAREELEFTNSVIMYLGMSSRKEAKQRVTLAV